MTGNAETPRAESGAFQKNLAGGEAVATVPQPSDVDHQSAADRQPARLSARPLVLITRGRVEFTAKCPGCDSWHRHRHLGDVTGPCGTTYELQPRRAEGAA